MTTFLRILLVFLTSVPTTASLSSGPKTSIHSVTVVGGVHGNEYTGVWCVKALEQRLKATQERYDSLKISTLVGNPQAHLANKRFLDTDLNRQFSLKALSSSSSSVEGQRAKVIDELLGPKFGPDGSTDCIIDLHSTTTNMGLTLIFPEGDVPMGRACAHALRKCKNAETRILFESRSSREKEPFLISVAPHGLTIEVGPVPQGVLRHDAVQTTDEALEAALDYLHQHNTQPDKLMNELQDCYPDGLVPCYLYKSKIPWPSDPENPNFPTWLIHEDIQDQDFHTIHKGDPLFVDVHGTVIPYDGKHGSPVTLIFINEGGYYYSSSGTGIGVAAPAKYSLETGRLVEED